MPTRLFLVPAALLTALLTLSGCVTVHGEEIRQPVATQAEAKRVLERFSRINNRANEDNDPQLNTRIEDGGLGAIDQAGLKVRRAQHPEGDRGYVPLEFRDTRYLVPKQAGWPRWFVADSATNRNDFRWLLVFVQESEQERWKATHLSLLTEDEMPEFARDAGGHVVPVPPGRGSRLTLPPERLSAAYARYLREGTGDAFAPGQHTTERRESRKEFLRTPDYVTQYVDQATPEYPAVALRVRGGGALVLFSTRHHIKQTMAEGQTVPVSEEAEALLEGTAESSLTLERVSQQAVKVPPRKDAGKGGIVFYNRLEGLVGTEGG